MIYIISLVGRVLSGCFLSIITGFERIFTIGDTKLVTSVVVGSFPLATVSPAEMKNFVVTILNGLERHIPKETQLPIAILFNSFGCF